MKNILLIIQREYLTRVRKKSFIVMTIVGPLLIAAMYGFIFWAALRPINTKNISIIDESGLFKDKFQSSEEYKFSKNEMSFDEAKKDLIGKDDHILVFIPADILTVPSGLKIFAEKGVSVEIQNTIERNIENEIESLKLSDAGITRKTLEEAKIRVNSETISLKDGGEQKSSAMAATAIGFFAAFLIYLSVLIYGTQVMRSVMEEKTSRIVEVIISSVKPFQLLIGKIIGVAMVGLTQFLLWIVLSIGVLSVGGSLLATKISDGQKAVTSNQLKNLPKEAQEEAAKQMSQGMNMELMTKIQELSTLPITTIIICFIIYFLGGYLMYSALFGAVGSAVDSETDTQQFMLPITIPIIASFVLAQFIMREPNGSLAFWTSMFPLTSPIIMMVRIPFGVPTWQICLSIFFLIGGFIFTTWVASRIYRVGILMYGKKVSWKELRKWFLVKM